MTPRDPSGIIDDLRALEMFALLATFIHQDSMLINPAGPVLILVGMAEERGFIERDADQSNVFNDESLVRYTLTVPGRAALRAELVAGRLAINPKLRDKAQAFIQE